jgi:hypothetical protein
VPTRRDARNAHTELTARVRRPVAPRLWRQTRAFANRSESGSCSTRCSSSGERPARCAAAVPLFATSAQIAGRAPNAFECLWPARKTTTRGRTLTLQPAPAAHGSGLSDPTRYAYFRRKYMADVHFDFERGNPRFGARLVRQALVAQAQRQAHRHRRPKLWIKRWIDAGSSVDKCAERVDPAVFAAFLATPDCGSNRACMVPANPLCFVAGLAFDTRCSRFWAHRRARSDDRRPPTGWRTAPRTFAAWSKALQAPHCEQARPDRERLRQQAGIEENNLCRSPLLPPLRPVRTLLRGS